MCVSPVFSFTLFTVLLDASLTDGQAMCVCLFKVPKQFSPELTSSGYLSSSAIDASAPDDLRGVGLAVFYGSFYTFCHVPVPCDILDLITHLRVFFAQNYLFRCWLQVVQHD